MGGVTLCRVPGVAINQLNLKLSGKFEDDTPGFVSSIFLGLLLVICESVKGNSIKIYSLLFKTLIP